MPGDIKPMDVRQILRALHEAQTQRAQEYSLLQRSFHKLLQDHDEQAYRVKLHEATLAFQDSSNVVRDIISDLQRTEQSAELLDLLQRLQLKEKEKLKFTLILQALRSAGSRRTFSWQQDSAGASRTSAHASRSSEGCLTEVQEPTELEYSNAIKEATQELQSNVSDINEILEELHFIQEDA